jgi:hypothetical protein
MCWLYYWLIFFTLFYGKIEKAAIVEKDIEIINLRISLKTMAA